MIGVLCAGNRVFAHKAVLSSRCEVMAAMLGGQFAEGNMDRPEVRPCDLFATTSILYQITLILLFVENMTGV